MALKPDQERVKNLLTDTLTLLCKNGLTFNEELKIQALIGVSVDRDVFIVHVNEAFKNPEPQKSSSPDLEVSDQPPTGLREKERNSAERRRNQAAASSGGRKQGTHEVFVDLTTGRDTPAPSFQHRHSRPMPASPRGRTPRGMPQPTTPTSRRGPYSPYGSPRTPNRNVQVNNGRFRSPIQYSPQMVGRGGRYMSPPQHMQGTGMSPRQPFNPIGQTMGVRRSLNNAMGQDNSQSQVPMIRQGQASPVIVLDEPRVPSPGRVLGSFTTTTEPSEDATPLTIEPLTIEPTQNTFDAQNTSNTGSRILDTSSPIIVTSAPHPSSSNTPSDVTSPQSVSPTHTSRSGQSPMTSPPVLEEEEGAIDDSLSRLALVIGDQQRARVAASESSGPGTPQAVVSPSDRAGLSLGDKLASSPPPIAQATIAALREVAKSTIEELQKGLDTPPPAPSSDNDAPSLNVSSIQGNFERYNDMGGGFKVLKKPPSDEIDDNQPPTKRRAMSPQLPRSKQDSWSSDAESHNGETKKMKSEVEEKKPQRVMSPLILDITKRPSDKNLSSWQVHDLLESHIVTPVLRKPEATVTSFRLVWRSNVSAAWRDVVPRRKELDDLVAKENTISFFISSITGENAPAATFPCIGYWVVTRHPEFNKADFIDRIRAASRGADLRMVLKEDGGTTDEFGGLCLMVKDHGEGVVQKHVAESAREAGVKGQKNAQIVRFVLKENFFEHMLKNAMKQLKPAAFVASLEKVI